MYKDSFESPSAENTGWERPHLFRDADRGRGRMEPFRENVYVFPGEMWAAEEKIRRQPGKSRCKCMGNPGKSRFAGKTGRRVAGKWKYTGAECINGHPYGGELWTLCGINSKNARNFREKEQKTGLPFVENIRKGRKKCPDYGQSTEKVFKNRFFGIRR